VTAPTGRIRIYRQPDGRWRWSYVEPDGDGTPGVDLTSHRAYESLDEARGSAEAAYPGVAVEQTAPDQPAARPPARALRLLVALLVLAYLLRRRWMARHRTAVPSS
jgi:hypothetical protein